MLGTLLLIAELATAAALVFRPSALWGGVAALVLLLAFMAGIGNALRRGRAPDCGCFGAIHSGPASRPHPRPEAALAVVAALVVVWAPGPTVDGWVGARSVAELVAIVTGVAAGDPALGSGAHASRQPAHAWRSGVGPTFRWPRFRWACPVGAVAPSFAVAAAEGETLTLEALLARGQPVALCSWLPGSGPSTLMLPDIERWRAAVADRLTIGVVGDGLHQRYLDAASNGGVDALQEQDDYRRQLEDLEDVMRAYRVDGTPSAVIVTPSGVIASATVFGRLAIEALIRLKVTSPSEPSSRHRTGRGLSSVRR